MTDPQVVPLGERAYIIRVAEHLDRAANSRAREIAESILASSIPEVSDVFAANSSVGVYFDESSQNEVVRAAVTKVLTDAARTSTANTSQLHEVPVRYDGPDLAAVAEFSGLSIPQVITLHAEVEYQVFAIGFAPGFAYMGEVDERIALPRRAQPRTQVPAGSVAIANRQTAIYPFATPGGWNIIGVTSIKAFDIERESPALFSVGDRVRFVPE